MENYLSRREKDKMFHDFPLQMNVEQLFEL